MQVADLLHGTRDQHVTSGGLQDQKGNRTPGVDIPHGCPSGQGESSDSATCVRAGPPATKPTPTTINKMPSQRFRLTFSCRKNRASKAIRMYPTAVAGST